MHFYIIWTFLFKINMRYLHTSFRYHFKKIILTNIFLFVKQICIKIHTRSWYIQKKKSSIALKYCTELILFKRLWKLTSRVGNGNFSKGSHILANISCYQEYRMIKVMLLIPPPSLYT